MTGTRYPGQDYGDHPDPYRSTGPSEAKPQHRRQSTKPANRGERQPRQQSPTTHQASVQVDAYPSTHPIQGYPSTLPIQGLFKHAEGHLDQGIGHRYVIPEVAMNLARRLLARKESLEKLAVLSLTLAKQWDPDQIFYPGPPGDTKTMKGWIDFFFGCLEKSFDDVEARYSRRQAAAGSFQPTQRQLARSYPDRVKEMESWYPSDVTLVLSSMAIESAVVADKARRAPDSNEKHREAYDRHMFVLTVAIASGLAHSFVHFLLGKSPAYVRFHTAADRIDIGLQWQQSLFGGYVDSRQESGHLMGMHQGGSLWCIGRDAEARAISSKVVHDVVHKGTVGHFPWVDIEDRGLPKTELPMSTETMRSQIIQSILSEEARNNPGSWEQASGTAQPAAPKYTTRSSGTGSSFSKQHPKDGYSFGSVPPGVPTPARPAFGPPTAPPRPFVPQTAPTRKQTFSSVRYPTGDEPFGSAHLRPPIPPGSRRPPVPLEPGRRQSERAEEISNFFDGLEFGDWPDDRRRDRRRRRNAGRGRE